MYWVGKMRSVKPLPGLLPLAPDPILVPSNLTWLRSTRKYHGARPCHSKKPPLSVRLYPMSSEFHVDGFGCGNVAFDHQAGAGSVDRTFTLHAGEICAIDVQSRARSRALPPPQIQSPSAGFELHVTVQ